MRTATCTPVDFVANTHFFGRDSGLMCRGFQMAGHESVVIMPGVRTASDAGDLIRTTKADLENVEWWRSLNLDLVLLYAWGDPRYLPIAQAIRHAGIRLIQNLDTAGLESPYSNFDRWWNCLWELLRGPLPLARKCRLLAKSVRDFVPPLYEQRRLGMLEEADFLATVSPPAGQSVRDYVIGLDRQHLADKIIIVPHPVSSEMEYRGETKQNRVLCVGRWNREDQHQKDPTTTLKVLNRFLLSKPEWSAEIIGTGASKLADSHGSLFQSVKTRVILTEHLDRATLREHYASSRILLCASRFESFHISSAEALCCGCSVVVASHPLLASTGWFCTRSSGTLATSRIPRDLAQAMIDEATQWETNHRVPGSIASMWVADLRCDQVAIQLIQQTTGAPK